MKISKEKVFKALGYTPHSDGQWEIHNDPTRFKVICCGRRWGKSLSAGHELTHALMSGKKELWIVGPTYELGEREFRVVHNDMQKLGLLKQCDVGFNVKAGHMKITTPWGSRIKVVSADKPKSLLGEGLDGVCMSEAAQHIEETWNRYIRPTLADRKGFAIFPSTPQGFNWYYHAWMRGHDAQFPEWKSWKFPSWTNGVAFPGGRDDAEIKEAERVSSTMLFAQEWGADFTTFEGRIYDEFDPRIHVVDLQGDKDFPRKLSAWKNYWSFDFGFSNPFVCLDIMVDPSDNVYVWREYYERFKATIEHGRVLRERANPSGFHLNAMFGDPAGADEIATLALVLGAVWGRRVPWKQGIEEVKRLLKVNPTTQSPRLFIDKSCVNLIREMATLRSKQHTQNEKNPKEGQHDYDDHACDALRYFASEFFTLGAGSSLAEAYKYAPQGDTAGTFFQYNEAFTLDSPAILKDFKF